MNQSNNLAAGERPVEQQQYRLDLHYVGTSFNGWQSQPDRGSVQDKLEEALAVILGQSVKTVGSSRTDSGVHALHQVASFSTNSTLDLHKTLQGLNALLPRDIGVKSLTPVTKDFHPIASAKVKVYRYGLTRNRLRHPFINDFIHHIPAQLDCDLVREGAKHLIGTHDFTSFCASDSGAKTKIRRLMQIEVVEQGEIIAIWFVGAGFLKQMVRSIVGTLIDVGVGKTPPSQVGQILQQRDRRAAGASAPAHGLCLMHINFGEPLELNRIMQTDFLPRS